MREKCQFCKHDRNPRIGRSDICNSCSDYDKFEVKNHMSPREKYLLEKLIKEDEWVNDQSVEFDRNTVLAVLQALKVNMRPSHDIFGDPVLVINRYRFEAVRKKFLDKHKK